MARRGDVMVRTWRPERDRRILVVLDTGRTAAGRVAGIPRLDASMDAILLLTALASRAGDQVDLLAFDRRLRARVLGAPRSSVLASVTTAMAPLDAELTETDTAALASAVLTVARRRCLVVLLTDLNPVVIEEGLLPRLGTLVARNQVMIAAVADPRLAELAAARDDADRVYSAAAAEAALAERRPDHRAAAAAGRAGGGRATGPAAPRAGRRVPGAQGGRPALTGSPPAPLSPPPPPAGQPPQPVTGAVSGACSMSGVRPAAAARRPSRMT